MVGAVRSSPLLGRGRRASGVAGVVRGGTERSAGDAKANDEQPKYLPDEAPHRAHTSAIGVSSLPRPRWSHACSKGRNDTAAISRRPRRSAR